MESFSGLGIGLSFLFGCVLMGLVAELYYLLWCKKKRANNIGRIEGSPFLFCWKKPISCSNIQAEVDLEMGSSKDGKGCDHHEQGGGGVEAELMRIHNLCGPPRFLFTIKEESKEDLESENGRSRRGSRKGSRSKSLGDLVFAVDSAPPFLTPLSSPTVKNHNYLPLDSCSNHGFSFNPLFESLSEAEVNRLRSSPPPKFKFLKDAEDKLMKKLLVEEAARKRCLMVDEEDRMKSDVDGNNGQEVERS